ncbi:hypothetical protein DRO59_01875 [Candidatus Bathyarchaeota archaeon]|nr:MAG: hypothetical protein DRO59_01875 [Candidatus Bathyarchaeota archaeon]
MEKIFGFGAKLLEIQIIKSLYKNIGKTLKLDKKPQEFEFTEYIAAAKRTFKQEQAKLKGQKTKTVRIR